MDTDQMASSNKLCLQRKINLSFKFAGQGLSIDRVQVNAYTSMDVSCQIIRFFVY